MYNRVKLLNKVFAHEFAHVHNRLEMCRRIEKELESENFHTLTRFLLGNEYGKASKWIETSLTNKTI